MSIDRSPSKRLTLEDAIEVWRRARSGEFQNRIAAHFDVNPGRINEILKGRKYPESQRLALG